MLAGRSKTIYGARLASCVTLAMAVAGGVATFGSGCAKVTQIPPSAAGGNGGTGQGPGGHDGAGGRMPRPEAGITPDVPDPMECTKLQYTFDPKIPTVFVLVDQSGSMWGCISKNGGKDDPT